MALIILYAVMNGMMNEGLLFITVKKLTLGLWFFIASGSIILFSLIIFAKQYMYVYLCV